MVKHVTVFDTEYTAWEGSKQHDWSRTLLNGIREHKEIVQIAALRINPETLQPVADPFSVFTIPLINRKLSQYFIDLTGITQEMLTDYGVSFDYGLRQFQAYAEGSILAAFGTDPQILNINTKINGTIVRGPFHGFNINIWAQENKVIPTDGTVYSGIFANHVGAQFDARAHNAMNDVNSILAALRHLVFERRMPNPLSSDAVQNNPAFVMPPPYLPPTGRRLITRELA